MHFGGRTLRLLGMLSLATIAIVSMADTAGADFSLASNSVPLTVRSRLPMLANDAAVANPSSSKVDSSGQAVATTGPAGLVSISDSTHEYQITIESDSGPITGVRVGVIVQDGRTLFVANDPSGRYLPAFAGVKTHQNLTAATAPLSQFKIGFRLVSILNRTKQALEFFTVIKDLASAGISLSLSDFDSFSTPIPLSNGIGISKCLTPAQMPAAIEAAFFTIGIGSGIAIGLVTDGAASPLVPILANFGAGVGLSFAEELVKQSILTEGGNYTVKAGLLSFQGVGLKIPYIQIVKDNCGKPLPPSGVGMNCPASVVLGSPIQCSGSSDKPTSYSWSSKGNTDPLTGVGPSFSTTPVAVGTVTIIMRACGSGGCQPDVSRDVAVVAPPAPTPAPTPPPTTTHSVTVSVFAPFDYTGCPGPAGSCTKTATLSSAGYSRTVNFQLSFTWPIGYFVWWYAGSVTFNGVPLGIYSVTVAGICSASGSANNVSCP